MLGVALACRLDFLVQHNLELKFLRFPGESRQPVSLQMFARDRGQQRSIQSNKMNLNT